MKICIIGWYGTETLGDRAILDGILQILSKSFKNIDISLGSLFPFLTERTLFEDESFYKRNGNDFDISIFNMKDLKDVRENIKKTELLIIGGGPLAQIRELRLISYAFDYAKKKRIQTIILGCGIEKFTRSSYKKILFNILNKADLIVLRDNTSYQWVMKQNIDTIIYKLSDPALISMWQYKKDKIIDNDMKGGLLVNLRDFGMEMTDGEYNIKNIDLRLLLEYLASKFDKICLLPNHYFFMGGDDREYMSQIMYGSLSNVKICHNPLSLQETYDKYLYAQSCIGMRYHAIAMQTILNGNNYILDYTGNHDGKIINFLEMYDKKHFYHTRYFNMHEQGKKLDYGKIFETLSCNQHFEFEEDNVLEKYVEIVQKVVKF